MAEMSHPDFRNFLPPLRFKYVEGSESFSRPAGKPSRVTGAGGEYALHETYRAAGRSDRAVCVFAGASSSRGRNRSGSRLCCGAAGLYVWILRLLSLRLRTLWILRTPVLRKWSVHRCGPLVSLGPSGMVLESRRLRSRLGSCSLERTP